MEQIDEPITVLEMEHSPYCIPVTRALEACGAAFAREAIPNHDRARVIEATDGNYYGVPVLLHGEKAIWESSDNSQDIARYVDERFADGRLFPEKLDGLQDILLRYLENEVELVTFKLVDRVYLDTLDLVARTMTIRHKERKFGRGCVEEWKTNAEKLRTEAETHFSRFEKMLTHPTFLLGEAPVYTDFLLYGILGNYTYRDINPLPRNAEALGVWFERMRNFSWV